jgi:hypothetical protein
MKEIFETSKFTADRLKDFSSNFSVKYKKKVSLAVLACAGRVKRNKDSEKCKLTHAPVFVDNKAIQRTLDVPVYLLNDLESEAYHAKKFGNDSLIIAVGTGLGVSMITSRGEVIATEDGHKLVDDVETSIMQLNKIKKRIEYEDLLAGKDNMMYDKMFGKNAYGLPQRINLKEDEFSRLYKFIMESFIFKLISAHSKIEIKRIILSGGVVNGNKPFFRRFGESMAKRMAVDVVLMEDDSAGIKGAAMYASIKKKELDDKRISEIRNEIINNSKNK